jgi:hypothetical protein
VVGGLWALVLYFELVIWRSSVYLDRKRPQKYCRREEMKSRPERNRKRPRGGIGCLASDGEGNNSIDEMPPSPLSLLRVEIVPLSRAFDTIIAGTSSDDERNDVTRSNQDAVENERRVRIIYPYPFTFATFAKARWVGKTVADIYHEEFGEKRNVFLKIYLVTTHLIK